LAVGIGFGFEPSTNSVGILRQPLSRNRSTPSKRVLLDTHLPSKRLHAVPNADMPAST
jgi:hypothetical protein